jgi:hypothetical protein
MEMWLMLMILLFIIEGAKEYKILKLLPLLNVFIIIQHTLTPKVLGVFFIKTASKQPLFKAR